MADKPTLPGLNTESAINQLLEAEAQTRERMAHCDQQAISQVEQARHRANQILERTNQRISRLHSFCTITTGKQINQLLQPGKVSAGNQRQKNYQETILAAAVQQLTELLTQPDDKNAEKGD